MIDCGETDNAAFGALHAAAAQAGLPPREIQKIINNATRGI
jgi:hypothetical protein